MGLIALLDDVAGLAKAAAASLDDIAAGAARSGVKAAGVVIDDAAVTPRYLTGFSASRELPVVWRIALGSVRNKLIILLPAALLLSAVAPWAITPILMLGGAYLCYEGAEKVYEAIHPGAAHGPEQTRGAAPPDPKAFEDAKIRSAVQTDLILSAEIMAISLASIPEGSFLLRAAILALVGLALTALVYGGVALIVKADDAGLALAKAERPVTGPFSRTGAPTAADRLLRPITKALGRALVQGMPPFLRLLAIVGTAAMVWVGGGIIIHGLEGFGLPLPAHISEAASHAAAAALPAIGPFLSWLAGAAVSGILGLLVGAVLIPVVAHGIAPLLRRVRG
nr:DUF808 domain-containing protein [Pararoseomonas indoligenes]